MQVKLQLSASCNGLARMMLNVTKQMPSKTVSKLYTCLRECNGNNYNYAKLRWEKEMQMVISESDWHLMC